MRNTKCTYCGFSFPLNEVQIELFCRKCGRARKDLTVGNEKSFPSNSSNKKNSIHVIDGVTPFIEVYCQGIRERKGGFAISCESVYDENGHLDFIYTLKD